MKFSTFVNQMWINLRTLFILIASTTKINESLPSSFQTNVWAHIFDDTAKVKNSLMPKTSIAQNFYVLKIRLNFFEISNQVLKFNNLIQICLFSIQYENLFETLSQWIGAMCVYSTISCDKLEHMMSMAPQCRDHAGNKFWDVWNKFSDRIRVFKFQNLIWDFK